MDVVLIFNGLGNQMSQYAFYLQKKQLPGRTRFIFYKKSRKIHNGYELDDVFGIKDRDAFINKLLYLLFRIVDFKRFPVISRPFISLFNFIGFNIVSENDNYNFNPQFLKPSAGITFYVGGWHSEKYFFDIRETVRHTFQFKYDRIGEENLKVLNEVKSAASVSVHVRRGDFLDANNYAKFGAVCTLQYFLNAIKKMEVLVDKPHFFFFTNDYDWVKENFNAQNFSIININAFRDSWKDMFLISNCEHHINSNGSFSWWSSWLNNKPGKIVIVPRNFMVNRYFEDIYPGSWIQLDTESLMRGI